jgi:hypothetical protein
MKRAGFRPFQNDMQNKRNIVTGLILAAIAIGIFLYTLMKAQPGG